MMPIISFITLPGFVVALFASGWYLSRAWVSRDATIARLGIFLFGTALGFLGVGATEVFVKSDAANALALYFTLLTGIPTAAIGLDLVLLVAGERYTMPRFFIMTGEIAFLTIGATIAISSFAPAVRIAAGPFVLWTLPPFAPAAFLFSPFITLQLMLISGFLMQAALRMRDSHLRVRSVLFSAFPVLAAFTHVAYFVLPSFFQNTDFLLPIMFSAAVAAAIGLILTFSAAFFRPHGTSA